VSYDELMSMAKERLKEIETEKNFKSITDKLTELIDSIWIYLIIGCSAVVVIWGAYIGIRLAVAKKNEQKADTQSMVKRLVIGIVIMFVLAGALPLLIKGLALWIGG
jgi:succinate dehydrogenase/fumarate reductase cytochrome b subunit